MSFPLPLAGNRLRSLTLCGLLLLPGCSPQDPYVPPDLLYFFASYEVGMNPTAIQSGDFNQDGFWDLVTSNISANTLFLLFGNGDGSFQAQVSIRVCKEPRNLAVQDFNGDRHQDLAIACSGSNQVAIFKGQGSGIFEKDALYPVNRTPVSIASGDFTSDQQLDLVVALRNDKLQLLFGNGKGKFRVGPLYEYVDTPTSVTTADFNQDGHLDLAVTNGGPMSNAVSIWLGEGDGTFQEGIDSGGDAGPMHGLAQDFDEDDIPDAAILNIQSGSISVLFGKGDGSFHYPPRHYRTPRGPFALTTLTIAQG